MRKLLYLVIVSLFVLAGCTEDQKSQEEKVDKNTKLKSEAIEFTKENIDEGKIQIDTLVYSKGTIGRVEKKKKQKFEYVIEPENSTSVIYGLVDYELYNSTIYGNEVTVFGTYNGMGDYDTSIIKVSSVEEN